MQLAARWKDYSFSWAVTARASCDDDHAFAARDENVTTLQKPN